MLYSLRPTYELKFLEDGYDAIIGIDEAGRGPWAGPVSVAAYIYSSKVKTLKGIHDSKLLNRKKRNEVYTKLSDYPDQFICSLSSVEMIDELGIGKTIEKSIVDLIKKIQLQLLNLKLVFLIDGYFKTDFQCEYELIRHGDKKFYSIAAASIIAKETRDKIMREYAIKYPQYGFEKHVGYGTRFHRITLNKYGPSPIHRKSFRPVRELA